VTKTSAGRNHVVLGFGGYTELVEINASNTPAPSLVIHGGYSSLTAPFTNDGYLLTLGIATTVKELKIVSPAGRAVGATGTEEVVFEHCTVVAQVTGITSTPKMTIRDTTITSTTGVTGAAAIQANQLVIDRVVIDGSWTNGIMGNGTAIEVDIKNLLVTRTTERAIDLPNASGVISFSTIADSGSDAGPGPRAVLCGIGMTIRSSIIWSPGTVERAPVAGCNLATTIAGPTPVPGALNSNPQFVDSGGQNYHIGPMSPARDVIDSGPPLDFERDPRPRGVRFDIGADEAE
jgi:hypothetical protein